MQKFIIGKYTLVKMRTKEYCKKYNVNAEDLHNASAVIFAVQYNKKGDVVSMSEENMLQFKHTQYAYTSRGVVCKDTFKNCMQYMLASVQSFI